MIWTQLRAFAAVAAEESVTRAARALNVSQPTLSAQIKALEETYGVRLFDRVGRGVALTALGRDLAAVTNRLSGLQQEAEALLSGARDLTRGRLTLGADSPHTVMRMMARMQTRHPNVIVTVSMGNQDAILNSLRDYRIDAALLTDVPIDDTLYAHPVQSSPFILISKQETSKTISLKDLAGRPMILREKPSKTRSLFEQAVAKNEVELGPCLEVESREAVRQAVLAGLGDAVVIEAEHEPHPDLFVRQIRPKIEATEYVACLADRRRLANIKAFMALVDKPPLSGA